MVTAKSESGGIVDALELGANDYVSKPVDFVVALARVVRRLATRRAGSRSFWPMRNCKANDDLERRVQERALIDTNRG